MEVAEWLERLGLRQYAAAFAEHAVDGEVLADLTAEDLKELGVAAIGHRRKLLAAIAARGATAPDAEPAAGGGGEPKAAGERRHVAILFADLVGYTRLTHEIGAEAMQDLLVAFFARVDGIVARAGGHVDTHIGDCVMAVFGAPVAHDNDAERAARAALEIRDAMTGLSAEHGRDLAVHVGMTTGTVVASFVGAGAGAEYTVTGESVNLASRLADAAGGGEIYVAGELHRDLADKLVCEPVGEIAVKGLADPVRAWKLVDWRHDRGDRGLFVGRRAEIRQVEAMLAACREDGRGQTLQIRGEAGIGKTRLSEELERAARAAGFACHRGLVLDFGVEAGRDAVQAVVRDLLGLAARDRGAAPEAVEAGDIDASLRVHLNDLLGTPQPEDLRRLYDAMDNAQREAGRGAVVDRLIRRAAAERPRFLIIEDVHWAKPPLLRALGIMARAVADVPAVLVVTSRIDGDPLDRGWRAGLAGAPFTTIDLSPLRIDEARAVCRAAALNDAAAIETCIERSAGNPLFLEQLLRHARDHASGAVPGTIQSLVQARIDQLGPADRKAIQAAAVVGQRVEPPLLRFLIEESGYAPDRLIEKQLMRPLDQDLLFGHALIRDAVYESLLGATRAALHRRAADWFAGRDLGLRAEHLASARAPEAATAFLAAAQDEVDKYHYETALGLIERGLAAAEAPPDRIALHLLSGRAWHDFGRMDQAAGAYGAALDLTPAKADRARALLGLAAVKRVTDDIDGALAGLARAEADAAAEGLLAEQAEIQTLRGNLLFPLGDLAGCLDAHETGLALARRAERPDLEAAAQGGLGDAEYMRGRMLSARRRLEACVDLARRQGLGRVEAANQAQIAHTLIYTATQGEAYAAARAAIDAAVRVGHARAEINARAAALISLFVLARYRDCLTEAAPLEACIDRLGATRFTQVHHMMRGRALHGLGELDQAVACLRAGLAIARDTGFAFHGAALESALALALRDPADRLRALERAHAAIAAGCVGHNQFRVYADGIDVAADIGDAALLRRHVALMTSYPAGEAVVWSEFHAGRGRALLARLEHGDGPDTRAGLAAADRRAAALEANHYRLAEFVES